MLKHFNHLAIGCEMWIAPRNSLEFGVQGSEVGFVIFQESHLPATWACPV